MITSDPHLPPRASLRPAAIGGLVFVVCYIVHRILQGTGPEDATTAVVAAYNVDHRAALLASEIVLGLGLLAFIALLAPLVPVLWRAGQEALAVAVLASGILFVAMGLVSTTAETALVAVADANEPAAVSVLNQFQGRVPVVLTIAALGAAIGLAIIRTGLTWRWLGYVSLLAAVVFLLAFVFSTLGSTVEGSSSIYGIAAFIAWMLLLVAGLWRAERR